MTDLALRGVTKRYGTVHAVKNADLVIAQGSRAVIVGPSGCGKTTLLRLISGLEQPSDGRIMLGETVLSDAGGGIPVHRRSIGYVAQEGALFPHLTVGANIAFGLGRAAADRDSRVRELMAAVELPVALAERRPHELSGGQQQRVALARALARRPSLMLLDEPFSSLDVGLRDAMREMTSAVLTAAGVTTVLVTHDQAEALSFADQLAVMREGRLVQSGSPIELYQRPRDPETARFLGEAIILDAALDGGFAYCALGQVAVDTPLARASATIMLRPEQVRVFPADHGATSAGSFHGVVGRLVSQSFRGATVRTVIDLPASALARTAAASPSRIVLTGASLSHHGAGAAVSLEVIGPAHFFTS